MKKAIKVNLIKIYGGVMKTAMVSIIIMVVLLTATLAQAGEVKVMVAHYLFQEGENATLVFII